jgi:hypothetical protein
MAQTPIAGRRELSEAESAIINEIKAEEKRLGQMWRVAAHANTVDHRWMSIAKTHFEEGFSAFVRAVARPEEQF